MRRFVIGTAGHVDHGKTTLVRALTGVDTDRLPEEKRRGISIELGFAPLDLGDGLVASVVDVPGHRRLVRAMIAGASGMELVVLVVAADEGVMPQTREHVAVCELLGLSRAVVVVTKADAVDAELAAMAGEEARTLLGERWRADVVTCSAKTGEGLDRVRAALRKALAELPAPVKREHVRLGVDRVFTVKGAGTVVTGTLVAGRLAMGDALHVVGERASRETAARALHVHDRAVERAEAPTRLAINLAGVALDEVKRGDVVTTDAKLRATTLFDVLLRGAHDVKRGAAVTVHVGTASTPARVDAVDAAEGGAVARVRLAHPTALAGGDRVVLRGGLEGPAGAVVGGGLVVDARPDRRASGAKRRTLAAALASLDADVTARVLVETASPRPLPRDALPSRFAVDAASLARAADRAAQSRDLARVGDHGWIARSRLDALVARARELVRRHHDEAPLERGLPLETLRARLAAGGGRLVAEEVLRVATGGSDARERLAIEGDVVRMPSSGSAAGAEATARAAGLARALEEAGSAGATEHTLGEKTGAKAAELRPALQKLARDGVAVRLGELWFAQGVIDGARRAMVDHFAAARTLTVVEFKSRTGLARKQAVAVLEHFDALGLTRREGERESPAVTDEALRALPRVDRVVAHAALDEARRALGAAAVTELVRDAIAEARGAVRDGEPAPTPDAVAARAAAMARARLGARTRRVVNATGVVLHTNLGRAPLAADAVDAMAASARGYASLELDLATGRRGGRGAFAERALAELCGAESALVVNNNAAAVLLALASVATGKAVLVSRGELVEIGGGFRIPEVLARSGARMVEVGTTNKTRERDYAEALDAAPDAAAILRVHPGNFRQTGFVERPSLESLVAVARARGVAVIEDLGGGLLADLGVPGLEREPLVRASIAAGADLVCFSTDKALGGPQGGAVVGRAVLVEKLRRDPLARALRMGRLPLVALEATLSHVLRGELDAIPALAALRMPVEQVRARAEAWARALGERGVACEAVTLDAVAGGGAFAEEQVPSAGVALAGDAERWLEALRTGEPPVVARIEGDRVVLDARTVLPGEDEELLAAVANAKSGED